MIRAGLLISAVANELFPLLKPSDQPSQGPWPLLIGFTVGLVFMSLGAGAEAFWCGVVVGYINDEHELYII